MSRPEKDAANAALFSAYLTEVYNDDTAGLEDKDGQPCSDWGKPLPEDVQPVVTAEPRVGVWLSLDALDWVYEEKEDG